MPGYTQPGPDPAVSVNEGELLEELHRQQEEILRLRDLLIARDAELGAERGKVAELEQGTVKMLLVYKRVRSFVPTLPWVILGRLRGGRRRS
jgi:hypothetical protein